MFLKHLHLSANSHKKKKIHTSLFLDIRCSKQSYAKGKQDTSRNLCVTLREHTYT